MILYMIVTEDKFELPLIVSDSKEELAKYAGVTINAIKSGMHRCKEGRKSKYVKVEVEDDVDDIGDISCTPVDVHDMRGQVNE